MRINVLAKWEGKMQNEAHAYVQSQKKTKRTGTILKQFIE